MVVNVDKSAEFYYIDRHWNWGLSTRFIGILLALLVAACQPNVEVRMERAANYAADGDYRSASLELKNVVQVEPENADARIELAKASYHLADFGVAETEYRKALELGVNRPEVWIGFGRALLAVNKAQQAFEIVMPNLDENSASEESLVFMADTYLTLGNNVAAKELYSKVLESNSASAPALIGLSVLALRDRDSVASAKLIDTAVQVNPESDFVWRSKGNYLRLRRDLAGAEQAYKMAIEFETPQTTVAERFLTRVNRTNVLIDSRQLDAAALQIRSLIDELPAFPLVDYLKGRLAFARGDFKQAQEDLQKYISSVPGDARGQAVLGATNFSQENYYQAEMYLIEAVRANVGGETTRRLLAETQLRLNKPEAALEALRAAEAAGQSDATLLSMLGRAEMGVGDTEAAIRYFEKGLASEPDNSAMGLALAVSYMQAGRIDDAVRLLEGLPRGSTPSFRREILLIGGFLQKGDAARSIEESERLVAENPGSAEALAVAGVLRQTLGQADKAREYFEKALELDDENLAAGFNLARLDMESGNLSAAERQLTALLLTYPTYVPALAFLGELLESQGRVGEMRPLLRRSISVSPQNLSVHVLLIRLETNEGNFDVAEGALREAREKFPSEAVLDNLQGRLLLLRNQSREGLEMIRRAASQEPDNPRFQLDLARANLSQGDAKEALAAARLYYNLRPSDFDGLKTLVTAELRAGDTNTARADVLEFIRRLPANREAEILLGDIELALGNPSGAIAYYENSVQSAWNSSLVLQLARAHRQAGTGNEYEALERWLGEHPDDQNVRVFYGQLLESGGKVDQAVMQYEKLVAAGSDSAIVLNNLAWQYALRGNSNALDLALKARELAPDDGGISDTLGWIYFKSGDFKKAVGVLRQAVVQSPSDPEIRYHLARALIAAGEDGGREILEALIKSGEPFSSREEATDFLANGV